MVIFKIMKKYATKKAKIKLLSIMIMYLLIPNVIGCAPGKSIHRRFSSKYEIIDTQPPNTSEHSISASGPGNRINQTDPELNPIMTTSIVFADSSLESPNRLSIKPCRVSLFKLANWVELYWRKKYKIRVVHGYLDKPIGGRTPTSLHLQGRAFDLDLVPYHKDDPWILNENQKLDDLRKFAGLAFFKAGFTYVKVQQHKNNHIHVSCSSSQSTQRKRVARCFPADSFVRTKNGDKKNIQNINIGDEVLTKTPDGSIGYSKIIMVMHRQANAIINDYITITTTNQKQLTLSPYHLVLTSNGQSKFARDVQENEILYSYDQSSKTFETSSVSHVHYNVIRLGAYAPLSQEGTIVVNDVYTSCYAVFPSHSLSHAVFGVWRLIGQYLPIYTLNDNGYHWYPYLIESIVNKVYTFPYQL